MQNHHLEQMIIGSLFLGDSSTSNKILTKLSPQDFVDEAAAKIFEAAQKHGADIIAVQVETEIDMADLISLAKTTPVLPLIDKWIGALREYTARREVAGILESGIDRLAQGVPTQEVVSTLDFPEKENNDNDGIGDEINNLLSDIISGVDSGITTGYAKIDKLVMLDSNQLFVFAARPGMGKTAFLVNMIRKIQLPVLFFSIEMSKQQIVNRLVSQVSGVDLRRPGKNGTKKIIASTKEVKEVALRVSYESNIDKMTAEIKAWAKHNDGVIMIDYLQFVRTKSNRNRNREQEISEVTRRLKILSGEIEMPVVIVSQLNRNLEARIDKRPLLSDLRESGSIEQDADVVCFLYRPEVYGDTEATGVAEVIVAKNRNGPVGTVHLTFIKETGVFEEQEGSDPMEELLDGH